MQIFQMPKKNFFFKSNSNLQIIFFKIEHFLSKPKYPYKDLFILNFITHPYNYSNQQIQMNTFIDNHNVLIQIQSGMAYDTQRIRLLKKIQKID